MSQELSKVSTASELWGHVFHDRRKKPEISTLSWMGRRVEDKINLNIWNTLNITDAEKLINQAIDETKWEWESIFMLRAIIEDLSRETTFSDNFFKKFDLYSKKYASIFYKYLLHLEENHSLMFSKLNTIFDQRNYDNEMFKVLCDSKDNLYPDLEIYRTFAERKKSVLKYYFILEKFKYKVDNLLKCRSCN